MIYATYKKGFTLIELMIVIAIIGILAAVAVPSYQSYVVRAKASHMIVAGEGARIAIEDYYQATGSLPNNNSEAGYTSPPSSGNIASVTIGSNGKITITGTSSVTGSGSPTVIMNPTKDVASGSLTWVCGPGTGLTAAQLPATCRTSGLS